MVLYYVQKAAQEIRYNKHITDKKFIVLKKQGKGVHILEYYLAPLEGITGYIYRNVYYEYFGEIDKYFTPFLTTGKNKKLSNKEKNDILPEHNQGMCVVPQILTNHAEDFIHMAEILKEYGYEEINLNLGCPSGTVVSKGRGAGFLREKELLNHFLEEIYQKVSQKISIKTRIGVEQPEEFFELLPIFNQYPVEELIIHPRIRKDYYKNKPNLEIFKYALKESKIPLCYNGDIFTLQDYEVFTKSFPEVTRIMCGRGVIANPGFICELKGEDIPEKEKIKAFHDTLYNKYQELLFGERTILFKMKEIWCYMIYIFSNYELYFKKIKKCQRLCDYEVIISQLFQEQEIVESQYRGK